MMNIKICGICEASYVPTYKEQRYCDTCMSRSPRNSKDVKKLRAEQDRFVSKNYKRIE